MNKIKLLIHEVFEKARVESERDTKNGLASYLWLYFKEDLNFEITEKSFTRYYDAFILRDDDIQIQPDRLDKLSQYLGYKNFTEFCRTFVKSNDENASTTVKINVDEDEESITEKISNVIINITNKPIFRVPEFLTKQGNLGIVGIILIGGLFAGNKLTNEKNQEIIIKDTLPIISEKSVDRRLGFGNITFTAPQKIVSSESSHFKRQKECMFWNEDHYERCFCDEININKNIIAYQQEKGSLQKIMNADTLTVENSFGKVWYSKTDGRVEFFNHYGEHPENGKLLKKATKYIILKYGKEKTFE